MNRDPKRFPIHLIQPTIYTMNHEDIEAIKEQERQIEKDIADRMPIVSDLVPVNDLKNNYAPEDQIYLRKIEQVGRDYVSIRRTRPDGNCFYRGFGYAYFESLLTQPDETEIDKVIDVAKQTLQNMLNMNYPPVTAEDFCDVFLSVVMEIKDKTISNIEQLLDKFTQQAVSDYIVVYLRLITSIYLQKNEETYSNFIVDSPSVLDFCKTDVEPMYKESDHLHIVALTSALKVCARIVYMDRGTNDLVNEHDFYGQDEPTSPRIHLLYRPGHYDILYPR